MEAHAEAKEIVHARHSSQRESSKQCHQAAVHMIEVTELIAIMSRLLYISFSSGCP